MAGNTGMNGSIAWSSAQTNDLRQTPYINADDTDSHLDITLSQLLDIEVYRVEEMVKCLEDLERMLEPKDPNNQTTTDSWQTTGVIDRQVNAANMGIGDKKPRSGIPIFSRRGSGSTKGDAPSSSPKKAGGTGSKSDGSRFESQGSGAKVSGKVEVPVPERSRSDEVEVARPPPSPPIDIPGRSNNAWSDDEQMEDESASFTESISVKSAAKMFGGQAIIRQIPTPSSKRRLPKPPPPKVPPRVSSRKPEHVSGVVQVEVHREPEEFRNEGMVEDVCITDEGLNGGRNDESLDVLDQPMGSLSEINGISECELYDNVDDDANIPSYEQFITGASLIDNDNEVDVLEDIEVVDNTAKLLTENNKIVPDSKMFTNGVNDKPRKKVKDYTSMDYTVLGTISPLNAIKNGKVDSVKEEMSFVLGHTSSPTDKNETGLKRCLSPQGDRRPMSPSRDALPPKRSAPAPKPRQVAEVQPAVRGSKSSREVTSQTRHVGIMCEGCNNCLLDLKRQALRLIYPDNSAARPPLLLPESIESIKNKLHVPENGYRFSRAGHCEVCDTHVSQIRQEAVSMVHSIQQAQHENSSTNNNTNIPSLIGSVNHQLPPLPRKSTSSNTRYRGSSKSTNSHGNYLSKSAPIAAQAQAYLEHNVRGSRGNQKRQLVLRSASQDRAGYKPADMYPQGGPEGSGVGHFGRPVNYPMSGSHFINTPYMQQQPMSMQVYQQQQQQQQMIQQHQQYYQYHQQQPPHHGQQQSPQHHGNQQQLPHHHAHQQQMQQHHQQQYPQYQPHQYSFLQHSHSAPGSPARIQSPPPRIQSPPPRIQSPPPGMSRIGSPPPSSPSLSRLSSLSSCMSSPPCASSPAASFFARAAQKLSKKKKRHHHPEPELPVFPTKFSEIIRLSAPPCPPCLLRNFSRGQPPGMGKVKVILRVVSNNHHGDHAASFLNIDTRNKQVTVYDPAASGYATSVAHRKAAMAPKMFAFDGVCSPDDCLTEVCSGSLPEIIQGVVTGADGCVFTYGYSKLGKSYTMIGEDHTSQTLGIVPTAIAWLFKVINEQKDQTGARFSVRVSAVEVSGKQEVLKDLLADVAQGTESGVGTAPGVYLREDPISGTQLENQSELRAPTAEKAAFYLDAALNSRTKTEEESRSSHLLFTLHVYQYRIEKENKAGLPGVAGGRSRLHLIDLGSASKSKDPNNVALSLSALGNVIMALVNGQRHVPHRDSKVAQLLRDSLGNITCRTCMIAHVSQEVPYYNESLQVIQLAARIHRMRRRKVRGQFSGTSSDDSSTDGSSIRSSRPYRGFRMGTLHEGSSLSDPDYTSSSESCNTVIYLGNPHQSFSDRELTDSEGTQRSVPRTNPRLPRRLSGSRSSGDEGSNSDSGRSLYRSRDSLTRLHGPVTSPVRDVSVTGGSRNGTPVRSLSRGATPVRDGHSSDLSSSCSPPSVSFNLPHNSASRTKTFAGKQDGTNPQCYASVNIVDKTPRSGARPKRCSSSPGKKDSEQWIDGPGAAIYPEKKQNTGEQWVDGPSAFVVKQEQKYGKGKSKMSSEEMWVDGPPEMLAENQTDENQNRTPKMVMHSIIKKPHSRSLPNSPKHQSPLNSPALQHRTEQPTASKPTRPLPEIKERPESQVSVESGGLANTAQAGETPRPDSMHTNVGDAADLAKLQTVKPFVKDWVERHSGVPDSETSVIDNSESAAEMSDSAAYRRSKPQDTRTKKLMPSSSTPKQSPHHSPRQSPACSRKTKPTTPKVTKPQFPAPTNTSRRVTDWLKSVESNQPEETIYMEGIVGQRVARDTEQSFQRLAAGSLDCSQEISSCSSVYPDTTLNDSRAQECADVDTSPSRTSTDATNECSMADMSFDSSVDTSNSLQLQNRDSIYELQMDEQLEKGLETSSRKDDDDETFSNASCAKDSDMDTSEVMIEGFEQEMKKSETIQSIKTLVGEPGITDNDLILDTQQKCDSVCNNEQLYGKSSYMDADPVTQLLSRKPDGASNPNLMSETFGERTNVSALREEYLIVNAISSQSPDLARRSHYTNMKSATLHRGIEGDGMMAEEDDKCDTFASLPLMHKPCTKCGYSQQNSKTIAKMCKDCQKMVALSIKNSHSSVTRKDKDKSKYSLACSSQPSTALSSKPSKSKSQSPSHSKLPVFSKNLQVSSKDSKSSRKKEKESKKSSLLSRMPSKSHDSDSGNDSGIVAVGKTLLSPYAMVTKPRTVSHSSSGHGSDNSSTMSADLISKQGSSLSDKLHGGTSSGYESMLRDSENSGSSTINEDSAEESSGDKKKANKKKRLPSTRRSRSAPGRASESPESSSRKSSPSSKNSSLSPTSRAWQEKHGRLREDVPLEIKDYDADDVKRMNRHRGDDEKLIKNKEKMKELLKQQEYVKGGKDTYIVDRSNWSFDCKFLSCFSCRSRKSDV